MFSKLNFIINSLYTCSDNRQITVQYNNMIHDCNIRHATINNLPVYNYMKNIKI